ncbi:phosphatidylserine/phosphatidylglycerophosphate/cardiolipin synthase family protein [Aquabacterium sp. J223]|uniref:phospholipase D-like domain-containing protein n=1 Tax=Aquabacterium sp. J223 TaxID=2898431 RepID=UPI0021AD7B36|nr:phospholipase D family protein [Aquabacterium sp. J223]UUX96210.1 phospholipase D family protein [Aquabacterium sp. J223]
MPLDASVVHAFTGRVWRLAARVLPAGALLMSALAPLGGCASLPPPGPRTVSRALDDPPSTTLGRRVAAAQPAPGLSGFRLVPSGQDALAVLVSLADQAQRTLDLQYYLVHNEPSTRSLLQHVRAAADRGVRVRLLVDDLNTAGNDEAFRRLTEHPRIEVRLFNPLPAGRFSTITRVMASLREVDRINRRMHNKMFVADNALAFMGGRNLGDAYFLQSDSANFVDLDVVVAGPAVQALSRSFDRYWNSPLAYPVQVLVPQAKRPDDAAATVPPPVPPSDDARPSAPTAAPPVALDGSAPPLGAQAQAQSPVAADLAPGAPLRLQWASARLLADSPQKIEQAVDGAEPDAQMFDDVTALLQSARREVLIVSPYLVPGTRGMALFKSLRERGVRVRVLTSSLASTDAPVVHIGYSRYRAPMLDLGIELHELRNRLGPDRRLGSFGQSEARLHAKAVVVDGRHVLIGSMNLDPRSMDLNSEIGLLLNSPPLAAELTRLVDGVLAGSSLQVRRDDQGRLRWEGRIDGGPVVLHREPDAALLRRLTVRLLAPFAPEEML